MILRMRRTAVKIFFDNDVHVVDFGARMARVADNKMKAVRAVERAIEILQSFSVDKPSMSVVELQKKVRLSRPTLYRLLHTLVAKGLVRAVGEPQRFALDYGVAGLAHVWTSALDVVSAAEPILFRLRDQTGETSSLYVLRGNLRSCVLQKSSQQVLSITHELGGPGLPLFRGASGRAILAFADEQSVGLVLQNLPQGMSKKRLLEDLEKVREEGTAVSRGEIVVGSVAIASPVFDRTGVIGSISIAGPQARIGDSWIANATKLVIAGAAQLSAALGHAAANGVTPIAGKSQRESTRLAKARSSA
jgi:DNA-binding IclR family transcriptional regulator